MNYNRKLIIQALAVLIFSILLYRTWKIADAKIFYLELLCFTEIAIQFTYLIFNRKKLTKEEREREEREKDRDIANSIKTSDNSGYYHNPDSINLTLQQKQMNQMYVNKSNPLLNSLGFGYYKGIQNSLPSLSAMNSLPNFSKHVFFILFLQSCVIE